MDHRINVAAAQPLSYENIPPSLIGTFFPVLSISIQQFLNSTDIPTPPTLQSESKVILIAWSTHKPSPHITVSTLGTLPLPTRALINAFDAAKSTITKHQSVCMQIQGGEKLFLPLDISAVWAATLHIAELHRIWCEASSWLLGMREEHPVEASEALRLLGLLKLGDALPKFSAGVVSLARFTASHWLSDVEMSQQSHTLTNMILSCPSTPHTLVLSSMTPSLIIDHYKTRHTRPYKILTLKPGVRLCMTDIGQAITENVYQYTMGTVYVHGNHYVAFAIDSKQRQIRVGDSFFNHESLDLVSKALLWWLGHHSSLSQNSSGFQIGPQLKIAVQDDITSCGVHH